MEGGGFDDFNIDKQEYQSVFKVFDKNNSGEITIQQVYELINKFDQAQKVSDQPIVGGIDKKGAGGIGSSKNPGGGTMIDGSSPNVIGSLPGGIRQQNTVSGGNFTTKSNVMRGTTLNGTTAAALNKVNTITPNTKKVSAAGNQAAASGGSGFGPGGQGL